MISALLLLALGELAKVRGAQGLQGEWKLEEHRSLDTRPADSDYSWLRWSKTLDFWCRTGGGAEGGFLPTSMARFFLLSALPPSFLPGHVNNTVAERVVKSQQKPLMSLGVLDNAGSVAF